MISGLDKFFLKSYDEDHYNCCHFVCEIWEHITGDDILEIFEGLTARRSLRRPNKKRLSKLVQCDESEPMAIALLQNNDLSWNHMGIKIEDRVFHISKGGPEFLPVCLFKSIFKKVRFYHVKELTDCS